MLRAPSAAALSAAALSCRGKRCRALLPLTELLYASRHVSRPHSISLYDIRVVSEEQIQSWVEEAEAGYDVEEMKQRGRGRPGRGAEPMQVVAVRLTAEEVAALDEVAERENVSRSEAIRRALAHFAA